MKKRRKVTYDSTGIIPSANMRLVASWTVVTGITSSCSAVADVNSTFEKCVFDIHGSGGDGQGQETSEKAEELDEMHDDG